MAYVRDGFEPVAFLAKLECGCTVHGTSRLPPEVGVHGRFCAEHGFQVFVDLVDGRPQEDERGRRW